MKNGILSTLLLSFLSWHCVCSESENNYKPIENWPVTSVETANETTKDTAVSNVYPKIPAPNNPEAVQLFNKFFQREVKNSPQLSDLFEVARVVTREEIAAAIFYLVATFTGRRGGQSAAENAAISQRYVNSVNDKPTPQLLVSIYADAVSLYLDQLGYLYNENARNLAGRYALKMKEAGDRMAKKDCPRSKLAAIIIGLSDFYDEQELRTERDGADISTLIGNLWFGRNGTGTPEDRTNNPKFYSKAPTLKTCNKLCYTKSKAVELFTTTFHKTVINSPTLKDLFNVYFSLTPAEVSRGLFYVSIYFTQLRGVKDAADEADFMARYARDIKDMKPNIVERVHSNSMAKILEVRNVLTTTNAKSMAELYAKVMEEQAKIFVDARYPKSKIVSLRVAFGLFYKSIGAVVDIDKETFPQLAYYYGNEWRCQSLTKA